MEDKPNGFLSDDIGNHSSMRLMNFISLFASIMFGSLTLLVTDKSPEGVYITFGFLLAAFAPKALQKYIEMR